MQGVYVSDMEIMNIVRYWKMQAINQPGSVQQITNLGVSAKPDTTTHEVRPRGDRVRQQAFWDAANQGDGAGQQAPPSQQQYRDATTGFDLPGDFGSNDVELDENAITGDTDEDDELYEQAVELVRRLNKASVSLLQRRLRIGYTRAARLIDVMEARGVVGGPKEGSSKPRDVLPV
jgi:DNA segregation ATPase FtsK/SpoIIIE-like protein